MITITYLTATVVEHDDYCVSVRGFRGVAFIDPCSGHWCSLRTGCVIAAYLGDELIIRSQRDIRASWQRGLLARRPIRLLHSAAA